MNRALFVSLGVWALVAGTLSAQIVPDLLYYRFNEGAGATTANAALPGAGTNPAPIAGAGASFGAGKFGTGLACSGQTGTNQNVATGFNMSALVGLPWTIEFWINPNATATTVNYCFGINSGGAFRFYTPAIPGTGTINLTGTGITAVSASGVLTTAGVWKHIAFVYSTATTPPTITTYVDGVAVGSPVNQTTTSTMSGLLIIGSQLTGSTGLNGVIDEFRLWGTARTAAEIAASYNQELFPNNIFTAVTSGGGVGDLSLSLASISPGAVEGYMLVTSSAVGGAGSGPFFGIWPSGETWALIATPLAVGNPLHFVVGVPGAFPDTGFSVPAGTLSYLAGQTWDLVCVVAGPSLTYLGHSQVQRMPW
jgi:hypothetical protein